MEAHGIPTLYLGSARDIMARVKPPRGVFLDYPLGRCAGKPNDADDQRKILRAFLAAFEEFSEPGSIIDLPFSWNGADRSWEEEMRALRLTDHARATLKRQRILGEKIPGFDTELRLAEETLRDSSAD